MSEEKLRQLEEKIDTTNSNVDALVRAIIADRDNPKSQKSGITVSRLYHELNENVKTINNNIIQMKKDIASNKSGIEKMDKTLRPFNRALIAGDVTGSLLRYAATIIGAITIIVGGVYAVKAWIIK